MADLRQPAASLSDNALNGRWFRPPAAAGGDAMSAVREASILAAGPDQRNTMRQAFLKAGQGANG